MQMRFFPKNLGTAEKQTLKMDMIQQTVHGLAIPLFQGIFILILVDYFNAGDTEKSWVSAALHFGFVLGLFIQPLILHFFSKRSAASLLTIFSGLFLGGAGLVTDLLLHVLLLLGHVVLLAMRINIVTALYADHYPMQKRAQLFSFGLMFSSLASVSLGFICSALFNIDLENYRWIYLTVGLLYCLSSIAIHNMPEDTTGLKNERKFIKQALIQPLKNLYLVIKYPRFGYVILIWFIFGFANLWTAPVRVAYLAEAQDGLNLDPGLIALIVVVIPFVIRMIFYRFWAKIFDKYNFIVIRIVLSSIIGLGLLLFFVSYRVELVILGQIIFNIAFSGSTFAWNLWVTKIAPPGQSANFMSVHTFFTGIRGIIGPFVGFAVFRATSAQTIGIISICLILTSVLLLVPLIKHWNDNGLMKTGKKVIS
jgi:MFS family permease